MRIECQSTSRGGGRRLHLVAFALLVVTLCVQQVTAFAPTFRSGPPLPMRLSSENTNEPPSEQLEDTTSSPDLSETTVDQQSEEEEEEQEDPEIAALKQEIVDMEDTLKTSRRKLAELDDRADDYTSTGYARKVAEMENMRRARSMLNSSNKYSAVASVLSEFVDILATLESLQAKYSEDEFGKQYGALLGNMKNAFTQLGVTEFSVSVGDNIDTNSMDVVEEQQIESGDGNTVLECLSTGLEVSGNVVRPCQVVASVAPPPPPKEEAAPEEDAAASEEQEEPSPEE